MADKKISALTGATTPLAGTEVLPIVQSGATVKVAVSDLTAGRAVSATQLTSTVAIGTAPLVVTSTTNVANLNASSLNGATFAAPGAIGGGTSSDATFRLINLTNSAADVADIFVSPSTHDLFVEYPTGYNLRIRDVAGTLSGIFSSTGLAVTENITPSTAAKGINFTANTPAAGMTSQLLNWYEEGTWTATWTGSVSNPTASGGAMTCRYTRIGRLVHVQGNIYSTSVSGGSGNLSVTGLPFAPEAAAPGYSSGSVSGSNWTTATPTAIRIASNALELGTTDATGTYSKITVANLAAYAEVYLSAMYTI